MKRKTTNLKTRLYLIAAIILLIGLGSAVLIYLRAKNDSDSILGYETSGGYVYPVMPEDSKKYMHDLELYGGKANVLTNEFVSWFVGLWHGKSLAFTIACITILIALGVFFVANHLLESDTPTKTIGSEPSKK
jgi:hypothetical protein